MGELGAPLEGTVATQLQTTHSCPFLCAACQELLLNHSPCISHVSTLFGGFFYTLFSSGLPSFSPCPQLGPLHIHTLLVSRWAPTGSEGKGGFSPWPSGNQLLRNEPSDSVYISC